MSAKEGTSQSCRNCPNYATVLEGPEEYQYPSVWCYMGVFSGLTRKEDLEALLKPTDCEHWYSILDNPLLHTRH